MRGNKLVEMMLGGSRGFADCYFAILANYKDLDLECVVVFGKISYCGNNYHSSLPLMVHAEIKPLILLFLNKTV